MSDRWPSRAVYWRCFHCGETFTKAQERRARNHFGRDEAQEPVCLIRTAGEDALLATLRNAQNELAAYRAEDTDLMRSMWAMASDHGRRVKQAEEQGYARALRDIEAGKVEPEHATRIFAAVAPMVRAA